MRRFSSHLSRRADSRERTLNERACMKSKNKEAIEEKRDNRRRHRVDAEKKRIKWMKREETRERVENLSWKLLENVEHLGTPKGRSTPTTEEDNEIGREQTRYLYCSIFFTKLRTRGWPCSR
uniref:uncharacterized protein LOC117165822 n=1 Tax=Bombus vancouverensis nearcticus TaxID=2705178 RepID=UPI00143B3269|nr:uncharacterized protein LOC117165822 [Bombus vancouverensis nearcticus]